MELKQYLKEHKWTAHYFAHAAGLHHQTILNILRGKLPRLGTAEKIEKITLGKVRIYNIYRKKCTNGKPKQNAEVTEKMC